jgi:hypothetical protein
VNDIFGGSIGRYADIIEEIKAPSRCFMKSLLFFSEDSNYEAHNLARYSITLGVCHHMWLGIPYSMIILVNILSNK